MDVIDMITKDNNVSEAFRASLTNDKNKLILLSDKESKWSLIRVGDHYIDLNTANDRVIDYLKGYPIDSTTIFELVYEYLEKLTLTNDELKAFISSEIDKRKLVFSKENGEELEMMMVDDVSDLLHTILESKYI